MTIISSTVEATTGQEWSPVSEYGTNVAMGAAWGLFGGGKEFLKYPLRGGGWNNRFIMATKAGLMAPLGFEMGPGGSADFMGLKGIFGRDINAYAFATKQAVPKTPIGTIMMGRAAHQTGYRLGAEEALGGSISKLKIAGKLAGPGFMMGMTAFSAIQGFSEGGMWGATKEVAGQAAMWAAWNKGSALMASLTGVKLGAVLAPAAAMAGIGYGAYKALEWGKDRRKGMRELEMVAPVVDPFGTGYTMRQRSIAAIQKSYINGRLAMGSEARLLHSPMLR